MTTASTEGERWAADALRRLRASGFAPPAIAAFLRASWRRAAETRRVRPELARQARRWSLALSLGAMGTRHLLERAGRPAPSRAAVLAWNLTGTVMLDWHLGMVEGIDGTPRDRLAPADALTLLRGALAPFAWAAPPDAELFGALLAVAGATDLGDGRLAARSGPTRLGRDYDPLADLCFRAAAVHGARRAGWIATPVARAHDLRQAVLMTGAAVSWFGRGRRPAAPHPFRPARFDAVPLLVGLGLGAAGHPRTSRALVLAAAAIGTVGLLPHPQAGRAGGRPVTLGP